MTEKNAGLLLVLILMHLQMSRGIRCVVCDGVTDKSCNIPYTVKSAHEKDCSNEVKCTAALFMLDSVGPDDPREGIVKRWCGERKFNDMEYEEPDEYALTRYLLCDHDFCNDDDSSFTRSN